MDEARAVIARLDRIDRLERQGASVALLLGEVELLLEEAQAWVEREGSAGSAPRLLEECRRALARLPPASARVSPA